MNKNYQALRRAVRDELLKHMTRDHPALGEAYEKLYGIVRAAVRDDANRFDTTRIPEEKFVAAASLYCNAMLQDVVRQGRLSLTDLIDAEAEAREDARRKRTYSAIDGGGGGGGSAGGHVVAGGLLSSDPVQMLGNNDDEHGVADGFVMRGPGAGGGFRSRLKRRRLGAPFGSSDIASDGNADAFSAPTAATAAVASATAGSVDDARLDSGEDDAFPMPPSTRVGRRYLQP